MKPPARLPLRCLLGLAFFVVGLAVPARAQTAACDPPCAAGDTCLEGRCYTAAVPHPAAPVEPASPPAAAEPAPPPAVAPRPAARRPRPHPRAEAEETEETEETTKSDDDVEGIPPRRRGLLLMPFFGLHSIQGLAADDFGVGGRFGALLGVHVDPVVSLNVEFAVDILNPQSKSTTASATAHDLTIAFSPLFHVAGSSAELVVGPKLGYWSDNFTIKDIGMTARASQWGWAVGANLGGFVNVNEHAALGLLLSYQFIDANQTCTYGPTDADRNCNQAGLFPPEILGVTVAALF
jgi:hypothetical protein